MKGSQRYKIRQVRAPPPNRYVGSSRKLTLVLDCPEREATYVITNGGISDPEKV